MSGLERFLPDDLKASVALRQLRRDDVERMLGYFESMGEQTRAFFHPHPFDRENAVRLCEDKCAEAYRIVVDCEGRIIGYAWFSPIKDWPYAGVGIGIADEFQGRRLGGALMDALSAEAKRRGLRGLRLTVYPNNERAIRLY